MYDPKTLSIMTDAMAVWEHVMDNNNVERYKQTLEAMGYAETRGWCAKLTFYVNEAYAIANIHAPGGQFQDAYDWEFIPWFFDACLTHDMDLLPEYLEITRAKWVKADS